MLSNRWKTLPSSEGGKCHHQCQFTVLLFQVHIVLSAGRMARPW